jgi:hypothetical protein
VRGETPARVGSSEVFGGVFELGKATHGAMKLADEKVLDGWFNSRNRFRNEHEYFSHSSGQLKLKFK